MSSDVYDDLAADYARRDGVQLGRMISAHGIKVEGRFICFRLPEALAVKLPEERVDALVAGGLVRFDRGDGRPMREWVLSPDADSGEWADLLAEAYAYRLTL